MAEQALTNLTTLSQTIIRVADLITLIKDHSHKELAQYQHWKSILHKCNDFCSSLLHVQIELSSASLPDSKLNLAANFIQSKNEMLLNIEHRLRTKKEFCTQQTHNTIQIFPQKPAELEQLESLINHTKSILSELTNQAIASQKSMKPQEHRRLSPKTRKQIRDLLHETATDGFVCESSDQLARELSQLTILDNHGEFIPTQRVLQQFVHSQEDKVLTYGLAVLLDNGSTAISKNASMAKLLYEQVIREGGPVEAMDSLALLFLSGVEGVASDLEMLKFWFQRAVAEGDSIPAMRYLGIFYESGSYVTEANARKSKSLYERAIAEGGDVDSMCYLGTMMEKGAVGVPADMKRAKVLYENAILEDDLGWAAVNLGILLTTGPNGVEIDLNRAKRLFERAVERKWEGNALYNYGKFLVDMGKDVGVEIEKGKMMYERAVKEGKNCYAMINLGNMLIREGKDVKRAVRLYEKAIRETGNVDSMCNLGIVMEHGVNEMKRDRKRAVELYERAIYEGRHVIAMCNLARLLRKGGKGVMKDIERSKRLLRNVKIIESNKKGSDTKCHDQVFDLPFNRYDLFTMQRRARHQRKN